MPTITDHAKLLSTLEAAQDAEHDQRERLRDSINFVTATDGQWEPEITQSRDGKPRFTFDMTMPVVDQVAGEMQQADFDIKVRPASGEASKEDAKLYDGLIRNIENISNGVHVFNCAGREMIIGGLSGWRVNTKFVDDNSFDQDLVIEPIHNYHDRVWHDPGSMMQDRSDAKYCFVLTALTRDDYLERFPEGSKQSVSDGRESSVYTDKAEQITIGEYLYIKQVPRELVLMSNGQVLEVNEEYESVQDELLQLGITEQRRRKRQDNVVYSRLFDGGDWLSEERETVFSYIPVIPTIGNFHVVEGKPIYFGVVEKLKDYQRSLNYAKSEEMTQVALAPRPKYWMTQAQAAGHEDTLETMNTNNAPVQLYNHDPDAPGVPQQQGGAIVNPGLLNVGQFMQDGIARSAGLFAANMGEQVNSQSGVAIKALQDKGNTGTIKFFSAQEIAICHTAKILIESIPRVYDTERQVRILGEDGSFSMATLNESVIDNETGREVVIRDLRKGKYDVTCSSGPAFQNRQEETVSAIVEMAQIDPTIIQEGGDILFSNVTAPGMDLLAERKRGQLFNAGLIPFEQMTDEEKQQFIEAQQLAAQQEEQVDPLMVAAQAEQQKALNEQEKNQIDLQEKAAKIQLDQQKLELERQKLQIETAKAQLKAQEEAIQSQSAQQAQNFEQLMAAQKQQMEQTQAAVENIKTEAETLKTLREAMGVDAIVGPKNTEAYIKQSESVENAITDANTGAETQS